MIKRIERIVIILALHGAAHVSADSFDALQYIESYQYDVNKLPMCRYEIEVKYSNGDTVTGNLLFKNDAVQFLKSR